LNSWLLVWFLLLPGGPVELEDVPAKNFPTESACRAFAATHKGIVHIFKTPTQRVTHECRKVIQT
jgi:hypothetical protein